MIPAINYARTVYLALIILNHVFIWSASPGVTVWFQDYGAIGFVAVSGFLASVKGFSEFPTQKVLTLLFLGALLSLYVQEAVAVILPNFALIIALGFFVARMNGSPTTRYLLGAGLIIAVFAPILSMLINKIPGMGNTLITGGTYPVISWTSVYLLGAALGSYYENGGLFSNKLFLITAFFAFIFKCGPLFIGQEYSMAKKPLTEWQELFLGWGYQGTTFSLLGGFSVASLVIYLSFRLLEGRNINNIIYQQLGFGTLTLYSLHLLSVPFLKRFDENPAISFTVTLILLYLFNFYWFIIRKNEKGLVEKFSIWIFKKTGALNN